MNIEVHFGGKDAGLFAIADSVKRRVNEITQASQKTTNSQRAIADLERQLASVEGARARQAWERLSTEQKIATLKQKQVELEKAATKAAEGSLLARGIGLKQSIVAAQIATLQAGGGGGRVNEIPQASQKTTHSQRAIADLERQLASVEGARARQAWERLSTEQKIATLKQKQVELEKAATKAAEGSLLARGISLKQSIVSAQIATLQAGGGGGMGIGGTLRPFLPLLSGVGAGALGSIAGGLAAGGIGVAVAALTGALIGSARRAMDFADSIGDAATTLRMSSEETLRLFRAAATAGLSDSAATGALSRLESVRASAAAGDMGAINLLKRYGVTGEMINNPEINTLSLATTIRKSLGSGGMLTEDRNALGKLFGRRPEKMVSILGQLGSPNPESEKDLKLVEEAQDTMERWSFAWKDFQLRAWAGIGRMVKKMPGSIAHQMLFPSVPGVGVDFGPRTAAPAPDVSVDPEKMSTWDDYQTLLEADRNSRRSLPRGAAAAGALDALSRIGLYNAPGSESLGTTATRLLESSRRIESKLDRLNAEAEREG